VVVAIASDAGAVGVSFHDPSPGAAPSLLSRHIPRSPCACRADAGQTVVTVARVTEPSLPDIRVTRADAQRDDARSGVRYLPSAQVLAELASLGPDLRRLAEDLRDRLSGPGDDPREVASSSTFTP
jgi:hypothetical protein